MSEIKRTLEWFKQAIPEPELEQASVQLGCHMEEFNEMFEALGYSSCSDDVERVSGLFKGAYHHQIGDIEMCDKIELLDAMVDQIVTAIGVCHTMGFDVEGALSEINRSNFSKFEGGKPVFNDIGKIAKGKDYTPPKLDDYI